MAGIDQRLLVKIALRHDPDGRGRAEALHGLRRRGRPGQGGQMPVVAIVIGGLGVGAAKTADAIMNLPPAVTLAFTPYGSDPPSWPSGRARNATRFCCRFRWSRSTIPTTIPARRPC